MQVLSPPKDAQKQALKICCCTSSFFVPLVKASKMMAHQKELISNKVKNHVGNMICYDKGTTMEASS
jgi:hypothetical protein